MSYWSAFIDGESRSVWMRRLSALLSISFIAEEEGGGGVIVAANMDTGSTFSWPSLTCGAVSCVRTLSGGIFTLHESSLPQFEVKSRTWCSSAVLPKPRPHQLYQFGPMVWSRALNGWDRSGIADSSNVTPARCWQMYPLDQCQEKQQGPRLIYWARHKDFSHCCWVKEVETAFLLFLQSFDHFGLYICTSEPLSG